ncbi:hypothetical protein [Sphingopyxis sp. PET50]|uniref:hypothetical protein n=1 Tax=Sphingopyxis sp. PET50 TaxID=2976533 RepID=UPI0028AD0C93|nr:hypothetical protein [Sphingopyxis sp. PET50]
MVGAGASGAWDGEGGALALWTARRLAFRDPAGGHAHVPAERRRLDAIRRRGMGRARHDRESGGRRDGRFRSARRDRGPDSGARRPWSSDLRLNLPNIPRQVRHFGNRLAICSLARNQRRR